ncbi:MAG: ATP synthase F1 subunit gamma [Patescibacteria group bacterium]|nr:ATP synthase F1 subunit gamma [Patescibacteria group bacterium]
MAGNSKEIQRRIKSIKNTRKITRAMEMVAAAKMKKEVARALAGKAYAHSAWNVLTNLSRAFEKYRHGLLEMREVKKILVVLVTSNRGLCGAYNTQIIKKLMKQVKAPSLIKINRIGRRRVYSGVPDKELEFCFIAVGKKGFQYLHNRDFEVVAAFDEFDYVPTVDAIRPLAQIVINDYETKKYDKVVIAYTDYKNALTQEPKLRQLLPVSRIDIEKQIEEMGDAAGEGSQNENDDEKSIGYKIEPGPREVVGSLLPRLVEMQLYHAILESNASRESVRMIAMKNATEAANDMVNQLQYSYNQIRQMNITREIAEITSGRIALE